MDDDELNKLFGMDEDPNSSEEGGSQQDPSEDKEESGGYDALIAGLIEQPYEEGAFEEDEDEEEVIEEEYEESESDDEDESEDEYEEEEEPLEDELKQRRERTERAAREERRRGEPVEAPEDFPLTPKRALIGILIMLAVTGVVLVATLDAFRIKHFDIEGNYVLSDAQIIDMSGLNYGSHLFFANYTGAAKKLENSSPYVRDCHVSFSFPSTVKITLDERAKIAYVKTPDGFAALDDQGIVVELTSGNAASDIKPVISGLNITRATLGSRIVMGNEADYQRALIVLGSLLAADTNNPQGKYKIFENTREVRVLPSGYIFLTIKLPNSHELQVKLDSLERISTQTAWLLYVIDSDVFDTNFPSGALDMTGDEYIYRQFNFKDNTESEETGGEGTGTEG